MLSLSKDIYRDGPRESACPDAARGIWKEGWQCTHGTRPPRQGRGDRFPCQAVAVVGQSRVCVSVCVH